MLGSRRRLVVLLVSIAVASVVLLYLSPSSSHAIGGNQRANHLLFHDQLGAPAQSKPAESARSDPQAFDPAAVALPRATARKVGQQSPAQAAFDDTGNDRKNHEELEKPGDGEQADNAHARLGGNPGARKGETFDLGDKVFANHPRCASRGPVKKIMYVKTHKTGSSTLANMFHRFAVKHNLRAALPRDNLFYAWPHMDPERIKSVVWQHNEFPNRTYDILCSAHVRYSAPALDALVPDAQYITVLRSPASHVKSSWSYWGVPQHIRANNGPPISLEEFVANPDKYWKVANRGDKLLLLNNQCFDLGLPSEPSQAAVDKLKADMDHRFFALITDYMDESLVLLKKEMCWDLEDVLYISLKSRQKRTGHSGEDTVAKAKREADIRRMNWADQQLYDHYNATLWRKIAQYPDFDAELAEYRRLVDTLSEACRHLSGMDEHTHRRLLESEHRLSELDRRCHYTLMDSMAFSKHLKKRAGALPTELECHTQGMPRRTLVVLRQPNVPDQSLVNLVFRHALRRDLPLLIPRPGVTMATAFDKRFMTVKHSNPKRTGAVLYNAGFIPTSLAREERTTTLLEQPLNRIAMVMDPVAHFVRSYKQLKIAEFLDKKGYGKIELGRYVTEPVYRSKLPLELRNALHNGQLRGLGYVLDEGRRDTAMERVVTRHVREIVRRIENVIVADRFIDSLLLLRRTVCWPLQDVAMTLESVNVPAGSTVDNIGEPVDVPPPLAEKIRKLQWMDEILHAAATRMIDRRLAFENDVPAERKLLTEYLTHMTKRCRGYGDKPDNELTKSLVFTQGAYFNMVVGNLKKAKLDEDDMCKASHVSEEAMMLYVRKPRKSRYVYV